MSIKTNENADVIFATIFVIIWVGAGVVTLNAKLLGGKMLEIYLYKNFWYFFF